MGNFRCASNNYFSIAKMRKNFEMRKLFHCVLCESKNDFFKDSMFSKI